MFYGKCANLGELSFPPVNNIFRLELIPIVPIRKTWALMGCSHGAITTSVYLSQLMSCMGFSPIVGIAPCEHLHFYPTEPASCKNSGSFTRWLRHQGYQQSPGS